MAQPFVSDTVVQLDPMSTAILLGLLKHLPAGTKLGVMQHRIELFEPGIVPWLRRTFLSYVVQEPGFNRTWLHNLQRPVELAMQWYRTQAPTLLATMRGGLECLQQSYTDAAGGNVRATIQLAIMETRAQQDTDTRAEPDARTKALRTAWTPDEVAMVESMFQQLNADFVHAQYLLPCLMTLVQGKHQDVLSSILGSS